MQEPNPLAHSDIGSLLGFKTIKGVGTTKKWKLKFRQPHERKEAAIRYGEELC
jgi:hypothetical protein